MKWLIVILKITKEITNPDGFTVEFYQTFKKIRPNFQKLFQKVEENTFQVIL